MDANFVEKIVQEVKSRGLFDEFRKDSLGEVDTKPAYQNLHSRVENAVKSFLAKQKWTPETNKIQLREKLRKHIAIDLGFLDAGVERIVDQVVNPKIATVFQPKIEEIAYNHLGIAPPESMPGVPPPPPDRSILASPPSLPPLSHLNGSMLSVETVTSLLPTDLEQISPDSDRATIKSDSKDNNDELPPGVDADENPCDDDDDISPPPFEPIVKQDIVKPDSTICNVQDDSLESMHTTHSVKEDISASFFAGASQQSQLSQVSSDSRLTAMSSISPVDADQSKDLTPNAAVNISEEAQMPNFNDNSCDATNMKTGEDLHFDIKKDAIKFEGTERRSSLSEVVSSTNGGISKLDIESEIMAEVEKNLAAEKNEILTKDEKQDAPPTPIAPDSSFGSCGGDTPSSTTPQKPTETFEQPDKDKPDNSIAAKDTMISTSSVVEMTTKPPQPTSQQEQPDSTKDDNVKQRSSSSSRHKKHSKDKRHHSGDKNRTHSSSKDHDKSRDKTHSTSTNKHSTSNSKNSSSSSKHGTHKSSSSRRDKNHQSNQSSSASSSRSSTTHDSNGKRSDRHKNDMKHKTSSSSSMSKSENKERSSSSTTKKSDRNKSSTTHDDHNESKTKKPRRKSNDSNDEGKTLNGKSTTVPTQQVTDVVASSPPIDKSQGNDINETNGNGNDNENGNGNGNENEDGNGNDNDNENGNGNVNVNENGNGIDNGNGNGIDNGNGNGIDNGNGNGIDNGNGNENGNDNENGNGNENGNENGNDNGMGMNGPYHHNRNGYGFEFGFGFGRNRNRNARGYATIIETNDYNANISQVIVINEMLQHSPNDCVELTLARDFNQRLRKSNVVHNDEETQDPPSPSINPNIGEETIDDEAFQQQSCSQDTIETNNESTHKRQKRCMSETNDESEEELRFLKRSEYDFESILIVMEDVIDSFCSVKNYYQQEVVVESNVVEEVKKVSSGRVCRNKRRLTSELHNECNTPSTSGYRNLRNTTQMNPNQTMENKNDDIEDDEQTQQQQSKRQKRDTKPSPALSDASSVNSKENEALEKNEAISGRTGKNHLRSKLSRTSVNKLFQQQRYTNDDLYKPRPVLSQRSRRRHLDSIP